MSRIGGLEVVFLARTGVTIIKHNINRKQGYASEQTNAVPADEKIGTGGKRADRKSF